MEHRTLKRQVRARMAETGENYMTALRAITGSARHATKVNAAPPTSRNACPMCGRTDCTGEHGATA